MKFISLVFIVLSVNTFAQKLPGKYNKIIGKEFSKQFGPRSHEKFHFLNDTTCKHTIITDSTEQSETIYFDFDENMITFRSFELKGGWMRYGNLLILFLNPEKLEKEFYGREFGSGCMIERTNRKGKRIYFDDFPGRP